MSTFRCPLSAFTQEFIDQVRALSPDELKAIRKFPKTGIRHRRFSPELSKEIAIYCSTYGPKAAGVRYSMRTGTARNIMHRLGVLPQYRTANKKAA